MINYLPYGEDTYFYMNFLNDSIFNIPEHFLKSIANRPDPVKMNVPQMDSMRTYDA